MKDLKEIGFYTLSDERVKNTSQYSQMKRCKLMKQEIFDEDINVDKLKGFFK